MSNIQYTSIDRILARVSRDLRGSDLNESDLIEWAGEASEFLTVAGSQEQALAFLEVKDHHAIIPNGFKMVLQIARDTKWTKIEKENCSVPKDIVRELSCDEENSCGPRVPVLTDCQGNLIGEYEVAYYRPFFDLKWEFQPWVGSTFYRERFMPVKLANNTLFNSVVCKEKDMQIYNSVTDEYNIVGTVDRKLRFSFKEGYVALAYLRAATDEKTGYPLIVDNISYISAVTYYIKWKIAEWFDWNGREGFGIKAEKAQVNWNHYCKQYTNFEKMPKTLDDYQYLLEHSHYRIPDFKKHSNFFGNINRR